MMNANGGYGTGDQENQSVDQSLKDERERKLGWGSRHSQAVLMFMALTIAYMIRVNFSVAIVAITTGENPNFPMMPWTATEQGLILSSFFWGYFFLQVPAGYLARKFGQSRLIAGALILSGLMTQFVPLAAVHGGWTAVCGMRIVMGLTQGFVYPSINTHLARWSVPKERSRMYAFTFSGTQMGSMLMMILGGVLAASAGGWPSIFYVSGSLAIVWGVVCAIFGADSPEKHKTISKKEKEYMRETLVCFNNNDSATMTTPWKDIVTSLPMYGILAAHLGDCWGFWTLLTLMPSYISGVLGFEIANDGFLSALPYLSMLIASNVFGIIADVLIVKKIVSVGVSRKLWNSIAHYGPALTLFILAYAKTNVPVAIALLTISVSINSATAMGYLSNHLDLAPNLAGTLMGITNGLSNITSILGPLVSSSILQDRKSVAQWQTVFVISAVIYIIGNSLFLVLGTSETQKWNYPKTKSETSHSIRSRRQFS